MGSRSPCCDVATLMLCYCFRFLFWYRYC